MQQGQDIPYFNFQIFVMLEESGAISGDAWLKDPAFVGLAIIIVDSHHECTFFLDYGDSI